MKPARRERLRREKTQRQEANRRKNVVADAERRLLGEPDHETALARERFEAYQRIARRVSGLRLP